LVDLETLRKPGGSRFVVERGGMQRRNASLDLTVIRMGEVIVGLKMAGEILRYGGRKKGGSKIELPNNTIVWFYFLLIIFPH